MAHTKVNIPDKNTKSSASNKIITFIGILLCIILLPVLIINITLIAKSYLNKDEIPKLGGYCPLIVMTGSMEPTINSGDLIIVKQAAAGDIKKGDIISFYDPDGNGTSVLTHRVTDILSSDSSLSFRTKGDANNAEDSKAVDAGKLIGIYKTRIKNAGSVAMFMQSTAGLIVCVILPLLLLVGYDIIRRRRYEKSNQADTAALLAELEELKAQKAAKEKEDQ